MPNTYDNFGNVLTSTPDVVASVTIENAGKGGLVNANSNPASVPLKAPAGRPGGITSNLYTTRGDPTTFNKQYDVQNFSYPQDLMADDARYGGNYAIFYINVSTESKLITRDATPTVEDNTPRDQGDLVGMKVTKTELVGANVVTGAVDGAIGGGLMTGDVKGAAVGTAKGGAVGGVVGGIVALSAPDAMRSQKRLKTAIALHIPNNLSVSYGVEYSEEDTAGFAMGAALTRAGISTGTEIVKALGSLGKDGDVSGAAGKAGNTIGGIATNLALSKGPNGAGNSVATGMAANPKKEQVFKGVHFRTFSFEYKFFPRNEIEAQNVLNIIKMFKLHMHPEFKDANNFVYIYPSEFDIFYYTNGTENDKIHRHTSCVLTDLSINYAPNGMFNTFDNGMPTQIDITLAFRELALLTKDKILDGL